MKLAMYQLKAEDDEKLNLDKAIWAIKKAAMHNADIILFPEIQLTKFFPQYKERDVKAMGLDDDVILSFCEACKKNNISAVPNIYLKENGKCFDTSLFIDRNGKILEKQKMVHIAQAEKFYEQDYYMPSDEGFKVFETEYGRIGMVICFDRHYPESIRTEALMGADLILIPTANTKDEPSDMFEWEIRVQAFQNSVAIAMCNRVGLEDTMDFCGESIVVDANGDVLFKADDTEGLFFADIELSEVSEIRKMRPYTYLRRKEYYE